MIIETALICLALNIFNEAGNQGDFGMIGVAEVTLNRIDHDHKKICKSVNNPANFGWVLKYPPRNRMQHAYKALDLKSKNWIKAKNIAAKALQGKNPVIVGNATHFINPKRDKPNWAKVFTRVAIIGEHHFYINSRKL